MMHRETLSVDQLHPTGLARRPDGNPLSAARVAGRIFAAAERLGDFPHIGHAGLAPGTYEIPVTGLPYILVHEVREGDEEVVILAVFHGAQDRPRE
jgi:toxin ParE1/3/4